MGALGPLILTVSIGMVSGYSAILLPQLELNNSTSFQIDTVEASWIGKHFFWLITKVLVVVLLCNRTSTINFSIFTYSWTKMIATEFLIILGR